jgi:hypothetical protein
LTAIRPRVTQASPRPGRFSSPIGNIGGEYGG